MGFVPFVLNWEFKMGFPSFSLAFFLVSHLLVLPSSGSCTSTIDCGYGLIKFPFTNTTLPQCGLCTIRCDEAVAQVIMGAEGRAYQISMLTKDTIKINDTVLRNLIKSNDCDFSSYFNPPKALSISYTISPNLTFFKCDTSSPKLENRTDDYFFGNYTYYRGCQGYTVYYSNQQVEVPTPVSIPGNCVIFQLPVVLSVEDRKHSDPFSLLASEFSVEYRVSEECLMCADVGGIEPCLNAKVAELCRTFCRSG